MGWEASPDQPRLVEIGTVPEFWTDGIGKIEDLGGGTYRLLLYRVHRPLDDGGPIEHEVVAAALVNLRAIGAILPALRLLACSLRDAEAVAAMMQ